jgi:hypothetical protein
MAQKRTCDICGSEATASFEAKTDKSTPLKADLCELHFSEYRKIMRAFLKQDFADIVVEDDEVVVKPKDE